MHDIIEKGVLGEERTTDMCCSVPGFQPCIFSVDQRCCGCVTIFVAL